MTTDPEFRRLIPPLREDERRQLEENLVANGCRDPLVLWRGILIDGHNRYEICERRGIKYRTVEIALPSRKHVLLWIEENQLGRRNLPDLQRSAIAVSAKERRVEIELEAKRARAPEVGKLGGRGKKKTQCDDVVAVGFDRARRSDVQAAKAARVPERMFREVAEVKKKAPEVFEKIRSGEITSLKQHKAAIKQAEKAKVVEKIKAEAPKYPEGPFRVIVVDPPWKYGSRADDITHRAANPYPDMTLDEIRALPIAKLAHADSVLWLWTTNAFLRDAFTCLDAWGFEHKTVLTWVKDKMGLGDWLRGRTEHCLMAARGRPAVHLTNQTTALMAPLREHSRKPDEFYALVEALCPGNKCELFARAPREGWAIWGAETGRFRETG